MTSTTPDLIGMLRQMILIREFDELGIKLREAGKIYGAMHPYVGQEAIAVGVCAHLTHADRIVSYHRGHGHCIAKGADIKRMMAELFGRIDGYCKGRGGSMHIADFSVGMLGANGVVGAGLPLATGAALAAQLEENGDIAVCFFGDGAVAEGEFHEALNISAAWSLPIVFVCENNQYASNNAIAVQHRVIDLAAHSHGYGIPGVSIDGNDVLAVFQAMQGAADLARSGQGPSLIECKTYRWHFHVMTKNTVPAETRPAAEIIEWKERDPIARLTADVLAQGLITESGLKEMRGKIKIELDEAVAFADKSPFPDAADLLADILAPS